MLLWQIWLDYEELGYEESDALPRQGHAERILLLQDEPNRIAAALYFRVAHQVAHRTDD